MPRIDPLELVTTLAPVLSPDGGIESYEKVGQIVQLMEKFSMKLTTKCIYVQILKATDNELLEDFLSAGGWKLLNIWFADAVRNRNWPFCLEMLELFLLCPISVSRLKDNAEQNQAPRLINQLRLEKVGDESLQKLSSELYEKWVEVVSPKKQNGIKTEEQPAKLKRECDSSEDTETNGSGPISLLQSLADEVSENIKKEEKKLDSGKHHKKEKKDHHHRHSHHHSSSKHQSSSDKKSHHHHSSSRSSKEKDKERDKRKRDDKDKEKEKERKRYRVDRRDEVDPSEKQRIKEIAKKLKEEEQAKRDKDTLSKIGVGSSSLSKMPKIPRKSSSDDKSKRNGKSFEDMLGGLDSKPKTVKTPLNKNKTASLLEGMTKSSSSSSNKHHHSATLSKKDSKESLRRDSSSLYSSKTSYTSPSTSNKRSESSDASKKPTVNISEARKRNSGDSESPKSKPSPNFSESSSFMDAIFSSMNNEPRKKKRRLSENESSKKSPEILPTSSSSPSSTTKAKAKTESKVEDTKEEVPTFSFYRDTLETNDEVKEEKVEVTNSESESNREDSKPNADRSPSDKSASEEEDGKENLDDLPFEEPKVSLPREVKGILVYHRGMEKRNRRITWKPETNLVSVRYFELDEDERVNVNKLKFENMREMELKMEKACIKSKSTPMVEEIVGQWYTPMLIDCGPDKAEVDIGAKSTEKDIQYAREKNVLQALYFNRESTPPTPAEPDHELHSRREVLMIPLEDQSGEEDPEGSEMDYSKKGWPDPKVNQIDQQANLESTFSLPPSLSAFLSSANIQNLFPTPNQLSKEEQQTLAAQTEAMKALGILPKLGNAPPPTNFPPPAMSIPNVPPSSNDYPPNIPPRGPPQDFNAPPPYPGQYPPPGMNGPPQMFNGPPPPSHYGGQSEFGGNFRGRGGHPNNRGYPQGGRGHFRGGYNRERDFRRENNDHKIKTKPCMYFANGFCRDGDRCRFIHGDEENHKIAQT